MTNKEILQASLLDILFEHRNKDYGAYALRKGYNHRLLTALGAGMSVILLFVTAGLLKGNAVSTTAVEMEKDGIVIRAIEMPKPKEQVPLKEVVKVKAVTKKTAQAKFTPPKIVEFVKDPMASVEDLEKKAVSVQNVVGEPEDKKVKEIIPPVETVLGGGPSQPVKETDFIIQEREPEFPGGAEAMRKFLARYLTTPDMLQTGEKKVVRIRFKVDKDGSVNTFEIVTSGGDSFDNEVVRVCKKMPKWMPAIQNGINVPVSYVLPVTFIGVEE
ncbi:MAG: TonB family protein [Chitinophagaceae bacterium]